MRTASPSCFGRPSEEDAWREALVRERRRNVGRGTAIGMAIWLPLAVVWWVLYAKVRTSKPRRIYLAIWLTLTSAALFLMFVAHAVGNGYSRSGYKWDIDKLAAYLKQPALPPELLPALETPHVSGFSYLRQLPPPEK